MKIGMDKIFGHDKVKELLKSVVGGGTVSHAYIFEGAKGVGRQSLAKAFAEMITGCTGAYNAENHPDIIYATEERFGDPKKKKTPGLSIDAVRALKNDVYTRPYMGEHKVYIVSEADYMAAAAQNSLLKVFEEPPSYCTIILIAENANNLLQTIRSRAVLVRIPPLSIGQVSEYLAVHMGMPDKKSKVLAAISGGSIGKAISLADDDSAAELRDGVIDRVVACIGNEKKNIYDLAKFISKNSGSFSDIADILTTWFDDVLHIKFGVNTEIVNSDKADELKRFVRGITKRTAFKLCDILPEYISAVNKNANFSIAVRCMSMEIWEEIHGRNYRSAL